MQCTCTLYFISLFTVLKDRGFQIIYCDVILLAEPPTPPTFLPTEIIAENLASGINVYRFRWQLPANIENTDIKQMKFQVDQQLPILLMNNSTDIILPLSYPGQHSVNIVAVDRCDRQSQATILQLQVKNGEYMYAKHEM